MKNNIKLTIIGAFIILGIGFIFTKGDLEIKENINVVSKSEKEDIQTINNMTSQNEDNKNKEVVIENRGQNVSKKIVTVFISGEVKNPGVVSIDNDKRLADAIEKLGGFTEDADLNKINLAIKIEDEKHYIIPKLGEEEVVLNNKENTSINNDETENKKININIATMNELDSLPGVGEATANKIISYREEKGKFNSIEEIKNVNGIGDKKYENIKEMISIN